MLYMTLIFDLASVSKGTGVTPSSWYSIGSQIAKFMGPTWSSSWGQHGSNLGPVGPRWAPCWPHEPCYQGSDAMLGTLLWVSKYTCRRTVWYRLSPCMILWLALRNVISLEIGRNMIHWCSTTMLRTVKHLVFISVFTFNLSCFKIFKQPVWI